MESAEPDTYFWQGSEACAEAAITAGCRFFSGYSITPASEIIEHMAKRLPQVGGLTIQMEDEMASLGAVIGARARGSAAKSEVIISDGKIGFPSARKCDILIATSQTALDRNFRDLKGTGILLVDSKRVESIPETEAKVFKVPATEITKKEFKVNICTNMIMLGVLKKMRDLVKTEASEKAVRESVPEKTVKDNLNALKRGSFFKSDQLRS